MTATMRVSFTLRESCRVLGVDRTTLRRWLARAHLHPQRDRHDHRKFRLQRWQIGRLALLHDRPLPDLEGASRRRLSPAEQIAELIAEVETIKRELVPRILVPEPGLN